MEKKEYNEKNELSEFDHGYESTVHKYISDDGEEVVFKKFKNCYDQELDKSIKRNKEEKLEILSSLNIPFLVAVKELLFSNGTLLGYTMPLVTGKKITCFSKKEEKIELLKELRKIMFDLNNQGIYVGDFGEHNFILTDSKLTCLDIDNYRLLTEGKELDFDTKMHKSIERFQRGCKNQELIDRYCLNMQTICLMGRYDIAKYSLCWLNKMPSYLKNNDYNWNIIEEMIRLGDNYQGNLLEFKRRN